MKAEVVPVRLNYINRSSEPCYSFPEHVHPFWEMILTIEGTGVQIAGGQELPFHPGSVLLIPPQVPHGTVSEEGCREISISFYDFIPLGEGRLLRLQDDEKGHLRYLAEWIIQTLQATDESTPSLTDALLLSLYQTLAGLARDPAGVPAEVLRLQTLLAEQMDDADLDVGAVMDSLGYSRGYLRRIFREVTGMPRLAWLNHRRIETAKQLFRQYPEVLTVRQIGTMIGFADPYYFSKLFKKQTGISPTAYRQRFLNDPGREVPMPEQFGTDG